MATHYKHTVPCVPKGHYGIEAYDTRHQVGRRKIPTLGYTSYYYDVVDHLTPEVTAAWEACWEHANQHLSARWAMKADGLFTRFGAGDKWRGRIRQDYNLDGEDVVYIYVFFDPEGRIYTEKELSESLMFLRCLQAEMFTATDLEAVLEGFRKDIIDQDTVGHSSILRGTDDAYVGYTRAAWAAKFPNALAEKENA